MDSQIPETEAPNAETTGIRVVTRGVAWLPEQRRAQEAAGMQAAAGTAPGYDVDDIIICVSPCPALFNPCPTDQIITAYQKPPSR